VRNSTEYSSICEQTYQTAWKSLKSKAQHQNSDWVIVMDLDETVLDNSQYQVELVEKGESFNMESWADWVNRAEASLVPGAKAFIDSMRTIPDCRFVFISNRMADRTDATRVNMLNLKVGHKSDIYLLRQNKSDKKYIRRQEVLDGTNRMSEYGSYQVLAYFGDAMGDFPENDNYVWGLNKFIFPNPMYGKW
jgi:5'-nucleotidase (lipoprotein e(P4) family)